jgi:hypothetical protein
MSRTEGARASARPVARRAGHGVCAPIPAPRETALASAGRCVCSLTAVAARAKIRTSEEIVPEPRVAARNGDEDLRADGRWRYGLWAVAAGLATTLVAFLVTAFLFRDGPLAERSTAVAAVLAPLTTVIGTMVGAYFGVQAGQRGAAEAQQQAAAAQEDARASAGDAAKGRALAAAIKAEAPAARGAADYESLGGAGSPEAAEVARRHAELARELFP